MTAACHRSDAASELLYQTPSGSGTVRSAELIAAAYESSGETTVLPPASLSLAVWLRPNVQRDRYSKFRGNCGKRKASQVSVERCSECLVTLQSDAADVISLVPSEYLTWQFYKYNELALSWYQSLLDFLNIPVPRDCASIMHKGLILVCSGQHHNCGPFGADAAAAVGWRIWRDKSIWIRNR